MNISVPMSARKSTSSRGRFSWHTSRRTALARLNKRHIDKKYILSLSLFVVMVGVLAGSLFIGDTQNASARERRYNGDRWAYYLQNNSNRGNNNGTTTTQQSRQQVPEPTVPQPTQEQAAPVQQPAVAQTTTNPQPASATRAVVAAPIEPPVAQPVDTAPQIAQMAAAQAAMTSSPVTYTTQRISDDMRNRLLSVAAAAVVVSAIMYGLTLIGGGPKAAIAAPIRYRIPVREVVTN